ncbi:MAG TPA: fumarylacetoacetate hydrolase family protein [Planctomycetota bacterium]|nr:fumarylacetoacetate hydrolase family protein [Planctomycetota bacterium]
MKLYRTGDVIVAADGRRAVVLPVTDWDALFNRPDLAAYLRAQVKSGLRAAFDPDASPLRAPIGAQEVWAAGVTYLRSRAARIEESQDAGGGDFYARVYHAPRPEIFFKGTAHRTAGPGAPIRLRKDSRWNVPEPELALAVNARGHIVGYTICNDVSSRDIEGENPLYLPQAKVYDGSCALGPAVLVSERPLPPSTGIRLEIRRRGRTAFAGATSLSRMKRTPRELVGWLCRDQTFPAGVYLSTGTGIVPPNEFTLRRGDEVRITIDGLGTLANPVI